MPISKSAKKSLRVSNRKASLNRHRKARLKEALKTASSESVSPAVSLIDKAAKWGIIHPNKAARLKSRLAAQFPKGAVSKKEKTSDSKPAKKAVKATKAAPKKSVSKTKKAAK